MRYRSLYYVFLLCWAIVFTSMPVHALSSWEGVKNISASDSQASDRFGYSVATGKSTMVVGAFSEDGGAGDPMSDSGAAYVFTRAGNTWAQAGKLTASDARTNHWFGRSVAISGDVIVVGASYEDGPSAESGCAYVFVKPTAGWSDATQTAILSPSDAQAGDRFGHSVAISGNSIVVGADYEDGGSGDPVKDAGAAYVYVKPSTGWMSMTENAKLTASEAQSVDYLGTSVSIHGDAIVVGAEGEDGGAGDPIVQAGAAYVYIKPVGGWMSMTENAKLTASDAGNGDNFGYAVSLNNHTIVVGAHYEDGGTGSPLPTSGTAYVFVKPQGGWINATETGRLDASDAQSGDTFGQSVSVSGEVVVVGAYLEDAGEGDPINNAGAAYVYVRPITGWSNATETQKLVASDVGSNDYFGQSVAVSGQLVVVGAYAENGGAGDPKPDSGTAYIYSRPEECFWCLFMPAVLGRNGQ